LPEPGAGWFAHQLRTTVGFHGHNASRQGAFTFAQAFDHGQPFFLACLMFGQFEYGFDAWVLEAG
jgi:hypothetical protein